MIQDGSQPIHIATMKNQVDVIRVLVEEFGVDPNSRSEVTRHANINKICFLC